MEKEKMMTGLHAPYQPYRAVTVANRFLHLAQERGSSLTNMQLQKLVFFAHGVHLGAYGRPLVEESVKAWTFGPVIPQLYNKLRKYGNGYVDNLLESAPEDMQRLDADKYALSAINLVWQKFGQFSGSKLSAISHMPGSPWDITWKKEEFSVIPSSLIQDYYAPQIVFNKTKGA